MRKPKSDSDDQKQQIIIKKIYRKDKVGVHSWKVAYADFVTALMAFFLLMWTFSSSTQHMRSGISHYFSIEKAPSAIKAPGGASRTMIRLGGHQTLVEHRSKRAKIDAQAPLTPKRIKALLRARELRQLQRLKARIKAGLEKDVSIKPYIPEIHMKVTPMGLLIQVRDTRNKPMFQQGSPIPMPYAQRIFMDLGQFLSRVPYKIRIVGNTDAYSYTKKTGMNNWMLSTQRANAVLHWMEKRGFSIQQVSQVIGLAARDPYNQHDPYAADNRRVSLLILPRPHG